MGNALAIRSERESLFQIGILSNKLLLGSVLLTLALQMMVVYVPFFQAIFNTSPLTLEELALSLLASTLVFWGVETQKWWLRRRA
jgi:P-type Ca2+ transporter type 2C